MNPLLDSEFLIQLNNDRNRTIYAHVISLNQYEHPIEQLEGVVTTGSITIDGQSAVRRTCSLTLSAKNLNINNVYWGISTKIKIEIGLQNNIIGYEDYGKIIWFKLGLFILTDFKTTQTLNNYTINLTGKDKMCLLNGDISGNLPAPIVFDSYTDASQQTYTIGDSELFSKNFYSSFQDDLAAEAILDGFIERYGSDYQYIRGAQRILSLNYIPKNGVIPQSALIDFTGMGDWTELSSVLSKDEKNNLYTISFDDSNIYGFQTQGCNVGDKFTWVIEQKIPIAIIIQEMLHQFGQERYSNIIIKDIEPYALEMLDNNFGSDFYLLHNGTIYTNLISKEDFLNNYRLYESINSQGNSTIEVDPQTGDIINFIFRNYVEEDNNNLINIDNDSDLNLDKKSYTKVYEINGTVGENFTVLPVLDGNVAGYGMTLLVYPDELRGEPGDSITSILDKIVNMLGNYEYFYNLDGQFVFQAKPAYLKTAWNGTIYLNDDNYVPASELYKKVAYSFDDATLTTQYQNTPNMNNIKNDYIIWGERKNSNGNGMKFHGRYAIDNPPIEYTDFYGYTWTTKRQEINYGKNENGKSRKYALSYDVDWRELIHIMADDWYANHYRDDYEIELRKNNSWPAADINLFPYGKTGFEQYYLDFTSIGGCWNLIYDIYQVQYDFFTNHTELQENYPNTWIKLQKIKDPDYNDNSIANNNFKIENCILEDQDIQYFCILVLENQYKSYLMEELSIFHQFISNISWLQNPVNTNYSTLSCNINKKILEVLINSSNFSFFISLIKNGFNTDTWENNPKKLQQAYNIFLEKEKYYQSGSYRYWIKDIHQDPEKLSFWFDFFKADEMGIGKFAVSVIGDRPKTINDSAIKTIIYRDTPDVIYCNWDEYNYYKKGFYLKDGYKYIIVGEGKNFDPEYLEKILSIYQEYLNRGGKMYTFFMTKNDKYFQANNNFISLMSHKYLLGTTNNRYIMDDQQRYIATLEDEEVILDEDLINEFNELLRPYSINIFQVAIYYNILKNNTKQNFVRSIRAKSVHEQADDMLYQYSYYNDTVNITTVPIYYLQPNTIISIKDELSKIIGYYIMDKINISLTYNGTMQITSIKAPERIY